MTEYNAYAVKKTVSCYVGTNQELISADSPQTFTYGGPGGAIDTITLVDIYQAGTFVKTLGYTGSNLTHDSGWVRQ